MDNTIPPASNESSSPPTPPPLPPVFAAPPVIAPPPPAKEKRKGRGWMAVALIALVLLAATWTHSVVHFFAGMADAEHGGRGGAHFEEVVVEDNDAKDKIVVVDVTGIIAGHDFDGSGQNMVKSIKAQLDRAAEDHAVKAVLLRVDSPGGEVLASDEIYRAIRDFQAHSLKPVIASMGSLAASGGYYVSAPCRWIVANELTITGSIGVIMEGYNYRGLLDKVGVQPMVFKSGKFKDMLSGDKRMEEISPEEKKMVQDLIDETFGKFKAVVREGRTAAEKQNHGKGRTLIPDWADYADGRIFSGQQAYDNGFVDELGNFDTAVKRTLQLAGVKKANLIEYHQPFVFGNLFRLLGKADSQGLKVDLGFERPKIQSGRLYFLPAALWR
ncbi:MAG: signal peptide peptidase SppA [Verrucomicrobia bacterium]|nr:signal peptide peptidase SppA [Verrucomicrobiota bacterium]